MLLFFQESCMDVRVEPQRRLSTKELMLLNCSAREDSWESLGLTARRSNQSILREINPCTFIERTDAESPILWLPDAKNWLIVKDPDAGKVWRQEERSTTGRNGCMSSPTQWTWVWASSRSWWWTGKPGVLQSMGSQGVRHDWGTELTENHKEGNIHTCIHKFFSVYFCCYC